MVLPIWAIFDTRFKTSSINTRLAKYISQETGIANVTFNTIADYVILICFMMKAMDRPKSEIMAFIRSFEQNCETFRKNVSSFFIWILRSREILALF